MPVEMPKTGEHRARQAGEFGKSETKCRRTVLKDLMMLELGLCWGKPQAREKRWLPSASAWGGGMEDFSPAAPSWGPHGPRCSHLLSFLEKQKRERKDLHPNSHQTKQLGRADPLHP